MRALLLAAAAGILTASVSAQEVVSVSTDTAVARGALVATDHDIAVDNQLGIIALEGLYPSRN